MSGPTHAERVAAAVPDDCKVVALLHDSVEDGHLHIDTATFALAYEPAQALEILTRVDNQTYAEYIDAIKRSAEEQDDTWRRIGQMALTVKIADLRDNLYGRPEGPPPESLRKRYEKALAILEAVER